MVGSAFALLATGCGSNRASVSVDGAALAPNEAETPAEPDAADAPATRAQSATSDAGQETRATLLALGDYATLGGTTFDTNLTAGRDVLLWFWAPW